RSTGDVDVADHAAGPAPGVDLAVVVSLAGFDEAAARQLQIFTRIQVDSERVVGVARRDTDIQRQGAARAQADGHRGLQLGGLAAVVEGFGEYPQLGRELVRGLDVGRGLLQRNLQVVVRSIVVAVRGAVERTEVIT